MPDLTRAARRLKTAALLLATLLCAPFTTGAAVLDFEALEIPGHALFPSGVAQPYVEDGFKVTVAGGNALSRWGTINPRYLGSTMLFNNTLPGTTTISEQFDNPFTATSITLARVNNTFLANSETFVGVKSDNSTVDVTFNLPGGDPALNIITFFFPASFTDLVSLSYSQDQTSNNIIQFDNVTVFADAVNIPLPGGLALMLLPVGLLFTRHGRG